MASQTQVAFRPGFVFLFILLIGGHLCWKATAWEHSEPDDLGDFDVEVDMDEDVIILDDSTFKYAVESREFLLVQFYSPYGKLSRLRMFPAGVSLSAISPMLRSVVG
eukprot:1971363-Rhodomonas_salina.2